MIEDFELRTLFRAESEEHLESIESGLLHLEAEPRDLARLETVFRAAHSLKGIARMLGLGGLETLAHRFEDELGAARTGRKTLSPEIIGHLYPELDAMRALARDAVTGEHAQTAPGQAPGAPGGPELAPMPDGPSPGSGAGATVQWDRPAPGTGAQPSGLESEPRPVRLSDGEAPDDVLLSDSPSAAADGTTPPASSEGEIAPASPSQPAYKVETIRVEPQRLDALMDRAGELAVTTARMRRRLNAVADLALLWEEWSRDTTARRPAPDPVGIACGDVGPSAPRPQAVRASGAGNRDQERMQELGRLVEVLRCAAGDDLARLEVVAGEVAESIRALRLLPLATLFSLFPRSVRDLAHEQGKEVRLVIEGGETTADKRLIEGLKDPLMHMIRNAIGHGIELPEERQCAGKPCEATLTLRAYQTAAHTVIEIADDGHGLDPEAIRRSARQQRLGTDEELGAMQPQQLYSLLFAPGFSTSQTVTDVSGRGVGLDVVRANVERLKGTIRIESAPGKGTTFRIQTRMTLATTHVLLVRAGNAETQWPYALPIEFVQESLLVAPDEVFTLEGQPSIGIHGKSVSVARLADLLELDPGPAKRPESLGGAVEPGRPCVLLTVDESSFGVFVDALVDEQEVMFKPLGGLLKRVRNVSGAAILSTGEICMILNPMDLLTAMKSRSHSKDAPSGAAAPARRKLILLAEDSLTTRTQEKRILEGAGYEVVTAVDGEDAFRKLKSRAFDAVVSDIQMPNVDGLALAALIRAESKHRDLPIILVTSLASEEDRRRGMEVGANAYLPKGTFEQTVLLDALKRLA